MSDTPSLERSPTQSVLLFVVLKPHVAIFASFLGLMTLALVAHAAFGYALVFAALLTALLRASIWHLREPTRPRLVGECVALFASMCLSYELMARAVPIIHATLFDPLLFHLDVELWGGSPIVWADRYATPLLSDVLSGCYFFFLPLLYFNLVRYFFWQKERLESFYGGLFAIYGLGFIGYMLVPAIGPYIACAQVFPQPLPGGAVTHTVLALVLNGSNGVDDWPSLHCAASTYILAFAFRWQRSEFWVLLLPTIGLWMSTIYLRYHYSVDDICGFALTPLGVWIAERFRYAHPAHKARRELFQY